jgi:hypothetical protein
MATMIRTHPLARAGLSLWLLVTVGCDSPPGVPPEAAIAATTALGPLTVTSITPATGFSGMSFRVTGTGFRSGAVVTLGGVQAFANASSESFITGALPVHSPGTVDLVVTNPGGEGATMRAAFTYATASVTVTPSVVAPGGRLQVNWSTPISHSSLDWIGLFRAGASNFDYVDYQYTDGVLASAQTWNAPAAPGQYEFRYLPNDGYNDVGRSGPVTVEAGTTGSSTSAQVLKRGGRGAGAPPTPPPAAPAAK